MSGGSEWLELHSDELQDMWDTQTIHKLPPLMEERTMVVRIQRLVVVPKYQLFAIFDDGKMVLYDVEEDIDSIPSYGPLKSVCGLFQQARLDASRTCISWNEDIDLPSDTVYEYGVELVPARA